MPAKELAKQLEQKRGELAALFAEHKNEKGELKSTLPLDDVRSRNEELNKLHDEFKAAAEIEDIEANVSAQADGMKRYNPSRPLFDGGQDEDNERGARVLKNTKSIGEQFVESDGYKSAAKAFHSGKSRINLSVDMPDAELKATLATTGLTGFDRQTGIVMLEQQRLTVSDLLSQGTTNLPTIRFMQETSFTNAATTVAEGAQKPEATFALNEADAPVRKIAVTARITDEMFADFPTVQSYVDQRLRFMVEQREEAQVLNGNGIAPNILGIMQTVGIQSQPAGADPIYDAIYKGMDKVRTIGFFEPDGVVLHPNDVQAIVLTRTVDGIYIWGPPSQAPGMRIWGVPIVNTTAMTENTGLVGAFKLGAQIFRRTGVTIESTNSNEDDFEKNLISLRAEERLALATYRPLAFCLVTGI